MSLHHKFGVAVPLRSNCLQRPNGLSTTPSTLSFPRPIILALCPWPSLSTLWSLIATLLVKPTQSRLMLLTLPATLTHVLYRSRSQVGHSDWWPVHCLQTDQSIVFPHYHTCTSSSPSRHHTIHPALEFSTLSRPFVHHWQLNALSLSADHPTPPSLPYPLPPLPASQCHCSLNLVYCSFFSLNTAYIVLFLCSWADSLCSCCMWFWMSDCSLFNIHQSGVPTALFGCCMAGSMWSCCHLGTSSVYTSQLCTSLQYHFIQSHRYRVHVYLAVTCHLHFWQNDWDLLCATAVTWGGADTKIRVSTESWSCHSCEDSNPRTYQWWVQCSNHWAILAPRQIVADRYWNSLGQLWIDKYWNSLGQLWIDKYWNSLGQLWIDMKVR